MTLLPLCNMHLAAYCRCMAATPSPAGDAPAATALIDFSVFDLKCAEHGAIEEEDRAALVGVDRVTLWRWRKGIRKPNGTNLANIAATLGVSLDELSGRRAA